MRDMFYTTQPMERSNEALLAATMDGISANTQMLYASDWPHWDFDLPSVIWDLPFLDETAKRNILGYNAARIFNLDIPERYSALAAE
jgi:predicted TIM-barrel fold metal-dependent hydrolase